ncbi:hypothetical protein DYB30_002559 [Aphanomyces astaci]|nr:hypothetical protein DYB30_002559 [Aphanomyces astaci]RHY82584.1 hypothetical protein DYB26_002844 [Aphanomyces astaci]
MTRMSTHFQAVLSLASLFFVRVDVIVNNWELNNYVGNADYFLAPLYNMPTPDNLTQHFSFPTYANVATLSEIGQFMVRYTVDASYLRRPTDYLLTAGAHNIGTNANDICGTLVQTYPLPANATPMRLGVVSNKMQLIRGNTLANVFIAPDTPPPPLANHTTLATLGFIPARIDVDMRLTTPVILPPVAGTSATANISMYRFASRAFCSGCDPVVELGMDVCQATYHVNSTSQSLVVTSSAAYLGEVHLLGLILSRSSASDIALYLRTIALLFAVAGFATSKKSTRWTDAAAVDTLWKRIKHTVAPPLYRYPSLTFTFSNFCLNSDFFVVMYVLAVLMDEKNSMTYARVVYSWNVDGNNAWMDVQLMAMQFRWLWVNCFVVKAVKIVLNYVSMSRFNGSNAFVGFCNFSSVSYLYLGAVFVMLRTPYIEYGNSDRATLSSTSTDLDHIRVDFYESWFVRSLPSMVVVMVLNLVVVLRIDRLINRHTWRRLSRNSLGRQVMFNSSSILCEMCYSFYELGNYPNNQAVVVKTRALCTVQWFLMCHTVCFGLPEDPKHVRAMLTKSMGSGGSAYVGRSSSTDATGGKPRIAKRSTNRSFVVAADLAALQTVAEENDGGGYKVHVTTTNTHDDDKTKHDLFLVAQDPDGIVHLYDARKHEVQAMGLEVKILSDARFMIG